MAIYDKTIWNSGDLITADKVNKIEAQLETVTPGSTNITNNYDELAVYEVGDYCLYNGSLWCCKMNSTGNAPVNGTYWQSTIVMDEIGSGVSKSIAEAYSNSSSKHYKIGDYVVYQRSLYRCIEATDGGTWDSTKWTEAILANDMNKIISPESLVNPSQINASIFHENTPVDPFYVLPADSTGPDLARGWAIGTDPNNVYSYGIPAPLKWSEMSNLYPCKAGDTIILTVFTNSKRGIIATYDENGNTVNVKLSDVTRERIAVEDEETHEEIVIDPGDASNYKTYSYTFQSGEVAFRVAHSIAKTTEIGRGHNESIVYIPTYHGFGFKIGENLYDGILIDGIITPAMFGAIGDGVTDDADAIQSMFDYAYYTNKAIQFPKDKSYYIGHSIMLRSYTTGHKGIYHVEGNAGNGEPNIRFDKAFQALFVGESFQIDATATQVNMTLKNFSARAYDDMSYTPQYSWDYRIENGEVKWTNRRRSSFAKRIIFTNESLMDNCKLMYFDVMFEASSFAVGSEIKRSTFFGFFTAFMTHKHRAAGEPSGNGAKEVFKEIVNGVEVIREGTRELKPIEWFTHGTDIGFFADSKMTECYISGGRTSNVVSMPPSFIGTHLDTDARITNCFFEFGRTVFSGGYSSLTNDGTFNGGIFSGCDFQYFCRLADCGLTRTRFVNCFFTSFSWEKIHGHSDLVRWNKLESNWENRKIGIICTDEDNEGNNTQKFTYNLRFYNCALGNCDRFIDLNGLGQTSNTQFDNSLIIEKNMEYNDSEHVLQTRVHFAGKFLPNCWSDTLDYMDRASNAPAMDNEGNIIDAFEGQHIKMGQNILTAIENENTLIYIGSVDAISDQIGTVAETMEYLGIGGV